MKLQQPSAFRPFMQELVVFPHIAQGASNHDIINGIGSSTTQRNDMIGVVGTHPFSKRAATIIASIALSFQFSSDILRSKRTSNIFLECLPLIPMGAVKFTSAVTMPGPIILIPLSYLGTIQSAILTNIFTMCFIMFFSTCLAPSLKTISVTLAACKTYVRKRFLTLTAYLAWGIILGYHVHDRACSLSGQGRSQRRLASSCLIPHYTTKPPQKQVREVCL